LIWLVKVTHQCSKAKEKTRYSLKRNLAVMPVVDGPGY